ncbi:MAG: hypothetical protein ACE5GD_09720 [Candidatus Geothermarchaeales archaeon]
MLNRLSSKVFLTVLLILAIANPVAEVSAQTVTAEVDGSYNYVTVVIHISIDEAKYPDWSNHLTELFDYAHSSRLTFLTLTKATESLLNAEIQRLTPNSYVTNLSISFTKFASYRRPSYPPSHGEAHNSTHEVIIRYDVYNVIRQIPLGPHAINMMFRGLKGYGDIDLGTFTVNPAETFLLDLSPFMIPMNEWNSTIVNGRMAYEARLSNILIPTKFGTMKVNSKQFIILPPDTIISSANRNTITYYTGLDTLGIVVGAATPIVSFAVIGIYLMGTRPTKQDRWASRKRIVERDRWVAIFWMLFWMAVIIMFVMVSLGLWSLAQSI